ncbi:MAG: M28 family peptidase [Candidatus Latescibacterota bacterium]
MKRRTFLGRAVAPVILPTLANGYSYAAGLPDSRGLVATPEKREGYLARVLNELCERGPRPTGSPELNRATSIVKRELGMALPDVRLDSFPHDCWQINGVPAFFIGTQRIEAFARIETAGTPAEGVSGVLRRPGGKGHFEVIDPSSGDVRAYITSYSGKARPIYASSEEYRKTPTMMTGEQDTPLLERALTDKTPVRAIAPVKIVPNTTISNVVGTLPGESTDEILFIAHLDTVYSTPGANDNTASVIIMLMLAHAASGRRPLKTLRFLATTGEENGGSPGATHYAEKRNREGTLKNIKYIVNFDSGTWNPDVEIWSEDKELQSFMQAIDRDLNINGAPRQILKTGFTLDARPFTESGARAIYVESNGQDKVHLWHRPLDTPANVQGYVVEINFQLFDEYIRRVQKM